MGIDAFGHEEDLVKGDRGQAGEEVFDFIEVLLGGDDKLELKVMVFDPVGNDVRVQPRLLMFL